MRAEGAFEAMLDGWCEQLIGGSLQRMDHRGTRVWCVAGFAGMRIYGRGSGYPGTSKPGSANYG